jgi:cytidine deaminase
MSKRKITTEYSVFESVNDLPEITKKLMFQAQEARKKAYAPYSNFLVGAAILLENHIVVSGNNQENSSYPSGLCAERTAIYAAGANYPDQKILQIAIAAGPRAKKNTQPVPPCGACRQAMAEYEQKQQEPISVYFMGTEGEVYQVESLLHLLPLAFDKDYLK